MKIYNKVVIDMCGGEILYEDSFEYNGPIASCGGSGGGGGAVSSVDPVVLNAMSEFLSSGHDGSDLPNESLSTCLFEVMDAAVASGGNPYSGETAYDPGAELEEMQGVVDTESAVVSALAYETDWEGMVTSVVSKLSTAGLNAADDIASTVSAIITSSLTDTIKSFNMLGVGSNTVSDVVLDKAKTRLEAALHSLMTSYVIDDAGAEMETLVAASTPANNARAITAVEANVASADSAADTMLSSAAASGLGEANPVIDKSIANSTIESDLAYASAVAKAKVDGNSLVDDVIGSVDAEVESGFDTVNTANKSRVNSTMSNSNLNRFADAKVVVDTAVGSAASMARTNGDADADAASTEGETVMATSRGNAATAIQGDIDSAVAKGTALKDAVSLDAAAKADTRMNASITNGGDSADSLHTTARASTRTAVTADLAQADSEIVADLNTFIQNTYTFISGKLSAFMTGAVNAADAASTTDRVTNMRAAFASRKLKDHMRSVSRMTAGMADYNAVNSSAFVFGMALLESDYADAVDAYDAEISMAVFNEVLRGYVGTFQGMYAKEIDAYVQEVSMYMQALSSGSGQYMQLLAQVVPLYLESYLRLIPELLESYKLTLPSYLSGVQSDTAMRAEMVKAMMEVYNKYNQMIVGAELDTTQKFVSVEAGMLSAMNELQMRVIEALTALKASVSGDLAGKKLASYEGSANRSISAIDGLINKRVSLANSILGLESQLTSELNGQQTGATAGISSSGLQVGADMYRTVSNGYLQSVAGILDAFKGEFISHLDGQIKSNLAFAENKNRFIISGQQQQMAMQAGQVGALHNLAVAQTEVSKMKVIAYTDQYNQDLQIDISDAKWDLEVYQYGANALASWAGASVSTTPSMTKMQSALSGAAAGASIGAPLGGWGIGIGAVLGGVAGLL